MHQVLYKKNKNSRLIDLKDEGILCLDQKTFVVNNTASVIWELVEPHRSATEIAEVIAGICNVPFDDIKEDIYQQLATFQELGFIEEVKETA